MHPYRTHTCADLRAEHVGQEVRISGWVHRTREHANVLFVDLRDHYGLTQVVVETGSPLYPIVDGAGAESVLTFTGKVAARSPETVNPKLATGEIEIYPSAATIQSAADRLPLPVFGERSLSWRKSASRTASSTCAARRSTRT